MQIKTCGHCHATGHTAFLCPRRPRTPLKTTKPMRRIGEIGRKLAKQSREFKRDTPTNHEGYHICYLCGRWLTPDEMRPEHTNSRAKHPEDRFNKAKLKPACDPCNEDKGSMDEDEYRLKKGLPC